MNENLSQEIIMEEGRVDHYQPLTQSNNITENSNDSQHYNIKIHLQHNHYFQHHTIYNPY